MASQQVLAVKQHWETMARQLLMLPLGVLVVLFLLLAFPLGWQAALRIALAGMFLLTASAHWGRRRPDLIRMVPDSIPRPDLLVTVTGLCEILGAIGLLVPPFTRWAAIGLAVLLIALFPANVRASSEGITIGGKPATPLLARSLIQVVFLMATIAVAIGSNG
jgi:uncharacterized membrane protein